MEPSPLSPEIAKNEGEGTLPFLRSLSPRLPRDSRSRGSWLKLSIRLSRRFCRQGTIVQHRLLHLIRSGMCLAFSCSRRRHCGAVRVLDGVWFWVVLDLFKGC